MGPAQNVAPEMIDTLETPAKPEGASAPPSALLARKIAGLRRRHVVIAVLTGFAIAVSVGIELLALEMFIDWWLDLRWSTRLVLLLAQAAVQAYILVRLVIVPILRQPDDDEVALMIERARPTFRSRLIASLQLTRSGAIPPGASVALVSALVDETQSIAQQTDFKSIISTERLKKFGLMAVSVLLIGIGGVAAGKATVWDLLKRAFLSHCPVPRKTHVYVQDGNKIVGIGDNVRLEAFVQGIVPSSGKVEVRYRTRRTQEFPLEQDKDNKIHFGRTIENVQDSFTYIVYLNDGISETYEVKAIPRPTVASIECEQEYPAYTQLKPTKRSLGDLSLLAGSKLRLKATATKPIKTASIKLVGTSLSATGVVGQGEGPAMQITADDPKILAGEFSIPAKGLTGFSIQMLDNEEMESRDAAVYRVDVLPDKPPVVRITYPDRKEELITRQATMIVGIDAADDFQIAKLRLRYKIAAPPSDSPLSDLLPDVPVEPEQKVIELDLEGQTPQRVRRRHEWKIGDFRPLLAEGTMIEYWVEAEDNNNVTGPGVGSTEHQLAKVVSESDKRADLLNRAGDYLGSINDVASDQEKLNKNLGTIIREKAEGK
jgi:hypothetical protein